MRGCQHHQAEVLCHNICVLIHSSYEPGIEPVFNLDAGAQVAPDVARPPGREGRVQIYAPGNSYAGGVLVQTSVFMHMPRWVRTDAFLEKPSPRPATGLSPAQTAAERTPPPADRVCIWCFPLRDDRFLRVRRRARMWFRKQQCPCQPVCLVPKRRQKAICLPSP